MAREVCWHCLHCHWYCDEVLEECRGQSEPCHEFRLCNEDVKNMENKFEDRLVNVNDVIEAVDKHTREDGTLDEDIGTILVEDIELQVELVEQTDLDTDIGLAYGLP